MSHPLALGVRITIFLGSHDEQSVCPQGGEQAWGRQPGHAACFAKIGTLGSGLALSPTTAASCLTWSRLLTLLQPVLSPAERRRTLLREVSVEAQSGQAGHSVLLCFHSSSYITALFIFQNKVILFTFI